MAVEFTAEDYSRGICDVCLIVASASGDTRAQFCKGPEWATLLAPSAIPITEKLLLNAGGWQAMKPARELLKGGPRLRGEI